MPLSGPRGMADVDNTRKAPQKKKKPIGGTGTGNTTPAVSPRESAPASGIPADLPGPTPGSQGTVPANVPGDTRRPGTAFGQQYIGAMYPDLYANPDWMANDWMRGQGIDPLASGGMGKVYDDLAQIIPQLWMLTQGTGGPQHNEYGGFLDFAGQMLNQYSTPGAGVISPSVISNLFNAPQGSTLNAMLNNPSADPTQQMNTLLGLIGGGLATGMPGPIAGAYMGQAEQMGQDWASGKAKGQGGTFADYLKNQGFADLFNY